MAGEVYAGLQGFKFLVDSVKVISQTRNQAAVDAAVVGLLRQLRETETEFTALRDRVETLERELAECKDWKAEAENYELRHVGNGCFAQLPKGLADGAGPTPMLCPNCFAQGRKSIFQRRAETEEMGTHYVCSGCQGEMWIGGTGL